MIKVAKYFFKNGFYTIHVTMVRNLLGSNNIIQDTDDTNMGVLSHDMLGLI